MTRDEAVSVVFEAWRARQARPHLCRLSADRRKLIGKALATYTADELCQLVDFAYEADHPRALFWRAEGDNEGGQTYLDLTNLLVSSKLDERMIWAMSWAEDRATEGAPPTASSGPAPLPLGLARDPGPQVATGRNGRWGRG